MRSSGFYDDYYKAIIIDDPNSIYNMSKEGNNEFNRSYNIEEDLSIEESAEFTLEEDFAYVNF